MGIGSDDVVNPDSEGFRVYRVLGWRAAARKIDRRSRLNVMVAAGLPTTWLQTRGNP
jgi:hypothetical protein